MKPLRSLLLIDNHLDPSDWGAPLWRTFLESFSNLEVRTLRGPENPIYPPPASLVQTGVLLSGSRESALSQEAWVLSLLDWMDLLLKTRPLIPLLGICFGHQLLCRVVGGVTSLRRLERPEQGVRTLVGGGPCSLSGLTLPLSFEAEVNHQEAVCILPSGFQLLATSEVCPIQACHLEGSLAWGFQFHPEKHPRAWFRSWFENFLKLLESS